MENEKLDPESENIAADTTVSQGKKTDQEINIRANQHIENQEAAYNQVNENNVDLDVYVNAAIGPESERIDFIAFSVTGVNGNLSEIDLVTETRFHSSRIMLVNHGANQEQLATATVDQVVLKNQLQHQTVCCTLQLQPEFSIFKLIRDFSDSPLYSPSEQALIVYENRERKTADSLVWALLKKGGSASSITKRLEEKKLRLIYVSQHEGLFEKVTHQEGHAALYLIHTIIQGIDQLLKDYQQAVRLYYEVMDASRLSGWLSGYTEERIVEELSKHILEGTYLKELEDQRLKINYPEEQQAVNLLLSDPLQNIVLFVATYFGDVMITEFDRLVKWLLSGLQENADRDLPHTQDLAWDWETNAPAVLAACGLLFDLSGNRNVPGYKFEKAVRKEVLFDLFRTRFRLLLIRRHEVIERELLAFDEDYSSALTDGWFVLSFENAIVNPGRYLNQFCLALADKLAGLAGTRGNDNQKKRIFSTLLSFIRAWDKNDQFRSTQGQFYERMKEHKFRRTLLGALLTHICVPEQHENLSRLRIHLESISLTEVADNFRIIREVIYNYLDNLPLLLEEVESWKDPVNGQPMKSASHIRCALLFTFYDEWRRPRNKRTLGNHLLEKVTGEVGHKGTARLNNLIFGKEMPAAFDATFRRSAKSEGSSERHLQRAIANDLQLISALALVQWYYLLTAIDTEPPAANLDIQLLMSESLKELITGHEKGRLEVAFNKTIRIYNEEMLAYKNERLEKSRVQCLQQKREYARQLIQLLSKK